LTHQTMWNHVKYDALYHIMCKQQLIFATYGMANSRHADNYYNFTQHKVQTSALAIRCTCDWLLANINYTSLHVVLPNVFVSMSTNVNPVGK